MNKFIHIHYIQLFVHTDNSRFAFLVTINVTQCALCLSGDFLDPLIITLTFLPGFILILARSRMFVSLARGEMLDIQALISSSPRNFGILKYDINNKQYNSVYNNLVKQIKCKCTYHGAHTRLLVTVPIAPSHVFPCYLARLVFQETRDLPYKLCLLDFLRTAHNIITNYDMLTSAVRISTLSLYLFWYRETRKI